MAVSRLEEKDVANNESEKFQVLGKTCIVHLTSTEASEIDIYVSGDGKTFGKVANKTLSLDNETLVQPITDCTPGQYIKFKALSGNLTAVKILG